MMTEPTEIRITHDVLLNIIDDIKAGGYFEFLGNRVKLTFRNEDGVIKEDKYYNTDELLSHLRYLVVAYVDISNPDTRNHPQDEAIKIAIDHLISILSRYQLYVNRAEDIRSKIIEVLKGDL